MRYPLGFIREHGNKQVAVRFPSDLFDEILSRAKKEDKSFNATVLDLVQCGKLCLDESDALEPSKH